MSSGASATKPQPPPPPSPPPATESSLDGLQFGQKIYFEDAAEGLAAAQAKPKKGRGGGAAAAQPLRCQVEGCNADLRDAKAYYSRHKVCDMHSKSPSVIVAGLDQRFCQQCSRFHQLPEFDQGKRSCRRRLANHNERRRKPPTGSLLTSRYARLSSPIFGNNGRGGGFVKDFAPHPKLTLGNALPCEPVPGIQTITLPWQANSQAPSDFFLQDSVGGTSFFGPRHLPVEGYSTQVTDSSCALSLLSNQTWGSKNTTPSVELNNLLNFNGTLMTQLATASSHQVAGIHHLPNSSWYFKGVDSGNCSPNEFVPDLGLGPGELDVGKSGACDSPHWSL